MPSVNNEEGGKKKEKKDGIEEMTVAQKKTWEINWKTFKIRVSSICLVTGCTLLWYCRSSSDHTLSYTFVSSPLLSSISSLSFIWSHYPRTEHKSGSLFPPTSTPGGCLPFLKSGAAFCVPAGSKALANGCSVHTLTSNRTNWHCKFPLN